MATRYGNTKKGRRKPNLGRKKEVRTAKASPNSNDSRRQKYASDPEFAEKTRRASRDHYRQSHPKEKSKIAQGLLEEGAVKEVEIQGKFYTLEVYTVPKAAAALGKTVVTFKRWLKDELLPPPVAVDPVYGYKHYTNGELKLVAEILADHFEEFEYLHTTHETTINQLWQSLQDYRRN